MGTGMRRRLRIAAYGFLASLDEVFRWLLRFSYQNLFFALSLPLVFLLLLVPQIFNIIAETVEIPVSTGGHGNQTGARLFLGYLIAVGAFCLASVWVVVTPHWVAPRTPMLRTFSEWIARSEILVTGWFARRWWLAGAWGSVAAWTFAAVGLSALLFVNLGSIAPVRTRWLLLPVILATAVLAPGLVIGGLIVPFAAWLARRWLPKVRSTAAPGGAACSDKGGGIARAGRELLTLFGCLTGLTLFVWSGPRTEGWLWWTLPFAVVYLAIPVGSFVNRLAAWPMVLAKTTWWAQLALGLALAVVCVWMGVFGAESIGSRHYPLAGAVCQQFSLLLGLLGAWLILQLIPWRRIPTALVASGRVLGWLVVACLIGEGIWYVAAQDLWGASYRLYTIWGVLQTASLVVVLGGLVDTWQRQNHWPMRVLWLVTLVLLFSFLWSVPEPLKPAAEPVSVAGEAPPRTGGWLTKVWRNRTALISERDSDLVPPEDERRVWYDHVIARLELLGDDEPAVFVAASGGGSRASIFTALVLEALRREPLGHAGRSWADHIVLISSVSGGSLANAYYIHTLGDPSAPELGECADLRNSFKLELISRMERFAKEKTPESRSKLLAHLGPNGGPSTDYADADLRVKHVQLRESLVGWHESNVADDSNQVCEALSKDARSLRLWKELDNAFSIWEFCVDFKYDPEHDWVLRSTFADAMCTDFMAPIVRGTLTPGTTRGESLRHFWTQRFGWHGSSSRGGYDYRSRLADPPARCFNPCRHPVALFNTCDVALGTRIASGFPPLPPELFRASYPPDLLRRPRTLEEADPTRTVSLADAVGMSANFPFGFNVLALEDKGKAAAGPKIAPTLHLQDGGMVDNTGIDTIYELLRNVQGIAECKNRTVLPPNIDPLAVEKCTRIAELLRSRRVVLLEIDSGAKPSESGPFTRRASILIEPMDGLNNTSYTNAELAKSNYTDAIDRLFLRGPDLSREKQLMRDAPAMAGTEAWLRGLESAENEKVRTLTHITFICNHLEEGNVLTAWSLAPDDKAKLLLRFLLEMRIHADALLDVGPGLGELEKRFHLQTLDHVLDCRLAAQLKATEMELHELVLRLSEAKADDRLRREVRAKVDNERKSLRDFRVSVRGQLDRMPQDAGLLEFDGQLADQETELDKLAQAVSAVPDPAADKAVEDFLKRDQLRAGPGTVLAPGENARANLLIREIGQINDHQNQLDSKTRAIRNYFETPVPKGK